MDKVKAPVLIFHGTNDTNVPTAQSWSFFRALQYYDKVPVKFVLFPGEPHGPRKLTHQMRKVEDEVAWFDKYFFKSEKPASDAVKKGSSLEEAIKRNSAKNKNGFYGDAKWVLIGHDFLEEMYVPEIVRRGDLQIGRFEVTRTQYLGCRLDAKGKREVTTSPSPVQLPAESGNLPAAAITLQAAQEYASCLSKEMHEVWRLPYEDEVKELYEKRDGENTLDYWAGYAPNPEDAAKLREAAKKLNGTAPLLKEVGSFHGQGKDDEEPIYDLGGNVAEWVLTRDGKGKVIGGSADCPAEVKSNCTPAPEYIGFRVVRGEAKPAAAEKR